MLSIVRTSAWPRRDRLEQEAIRRAVDGDERPVYQGGKLVTPAVATRMRQEALQAAASKNRYCGNHCPGPDRPSWGEYERGWNGVVVPFLTYPNAPEINLDERRIRQLILNLTCNGIEAMSEGGELTISTQTNKDLVVLSVKDQGKGVHPKVLEKLGAPFLTTKEMGTGLGLAVCYRIAEKHNATIQIETGEQGTTFIIHQFSDTCSR